MEVCRVPSSEPDSTNWSSPPTSSGLPVTPPDHTVAPQLPCLFQLQPPKSPQPYYIPETMLSFSPIRTGPAFSTGNEDRFTSMQHPLKSKLNLNEGSKDVFQSLKRKRLPVAAAFSRPRPRTLPVKKVLPKIHGCRTCGKMFDRPSTLLVVSVTTYLAFIGSTLSNRHSTRPVTRKPKVSPNNILNYSRSLMFALLQTMLAINVGRRSASIATCDDTGATALRLQGTAQFHRPLPYLSNKECRRPRQSRQSRTLLIRHHRWPDLPDLSSISHLHLTPDSYLRHPGTKPCHRAYPYRSLLPRSLLPRSLLPRSLLPRWPRNRRPSASGSWW